MLIYHIFHGLLKIRKLLMLLFPMIYYFCTHLDKHNDHEKQTIFYYSSHAAVSNIAICTIRHCQTIRSILSDRSYPLHRKADRNSRIFLEFAQRHRLVRKLYLPGILRLLQSLPPICSWILFVVYHIPYCRLYITGIRFR